MSIQPLPLIIVGSTSGINLNASQIESGIILVNLSASSPGNPCIFNLPVGLGVKLFTDLSPTNRVLGYQFKVKLSAVNAYTGSHTFTLVNNDSYYIDTSNGPINIWTGASWNIFTEMLWVLTSISPIKWTIYSLGYGL